MKFSLRTYFLVVFIFLLGGVCHHLALAEDKLFNLKLHKSFPVEGPENIQPSGLTIWNEQLYTVSDKHDTVIFRIIFNENNAVLQPYLTFNPPDPHNRGWFDFEGITMDDKGNFYLISETRFKILQVRADGSVVYWITPSIRPFGENEGLFQVHNAYGEGITFISPNKFIICAERQPRGMIEINLQSSPASIMAHRCEESKFGFPPGVSTDFAGLFYFKDALYVLQRNAYLISQLTVDERGCSEGPGWSYHHIVTRDEFRYTDMQYGHAEGLAIDENYFYIILDNNGDPRKTDSEDRRPLLFLLEPPKSNY